MGDACGLGAGRIRRKKGKNCVHGMGRRGREKKERLN